MALQEMSLWKQVTGGSTASGTTVVVVRTLQV